MLVDRRRRSDPWLVWKVRIFSVAAGMGLMGIYFEERWMTGGAILLLAVAVALRFLPGGGRVEEEDTDHMTDPLQAEEAVDGEAASEAGGEGVPDTAEDGGEGEAAAGRA